MYKVLIADDEVKVCKLINHLIEWEEYGLEVTAMVNDGVSALQYIKEARPDIVITDIRMPGYDGIELIRLAKEFDPEINFIIVSGYRHFDYAHNAIKYGVEDYLLKPLKKSEMISTLTKMIGKKEQAALGRNEKADMKRRINLDEKILKQTFLDKLLTDPTLLENITREELNHEFHCNFIEGLYQGIVVKPDLVTIQEEERSYGLLMDKAKDITQKQLGEYFHEVIITLTKEGIICLVNDSFANMQNIRRQLKLLRSDILRMRDVFTNVRITIGMGEAVMKEKDIMDTLKGARSTILNRLIQGTGHILTTANNQKEKRLPYDILEHDFRNKFLNYIETLNSDGMLHLMNETKEKITKYKYIDGELILDVCREIYDIFIFGMGFLTAKDLRKKEEFERRFFRCYSLAGAFDQLTEEIVTQLEQLNQDKKLADKKPIRLAKQYMKEKYTQPITLEEVSNQIGFNPTYFSSLFKKETGQNFLEYLTDTRIQAAKQLLADTNRSVIQVSEEVGYIDIKHFTKLFKKATGLTPSEYRKLYY
ncbi:MAG: response regulator [Herbinix sp.]|jgi:two-component system response regulator YesN|nr:response regulator [Herbinix sp.]